MPVPDSFTTTADRVTFLDFSGDELIMRVFVPDGGGKPAIKINTQDSDEGGPLIYVPTTCIDELIQNLQHLKQRALELAEQQRATISE